ncbi:MAG TPA: alpha/beta fold hydrolase, partial [Gemmatimonadales bacterium]|nr:alpha/beta fold hydrolase [Gemmatimonadales bacterium]
PLDQRTTLDSVRRTVRASGSREALVFIHGYNVTFHDAALRTAQLTYDLGFDGAPILYSWPSRGSLFHYASDREAAEWSAAHLRGFLDSIVAITGARKLHVIAHSMGNRALTLALQRGPASDTLFSNLVLAAPDVDADLFAQQIASAIRPLTQRLTVYMSSKDKALRLSRWLSTHRRLGEATSPMLVVKSVDTIDASELDTDLLGHGYIASNRDVIDDLVLLVSEKRSPPRTRLRRSSFNGQTYWLLP